jgi:hypothetical protein
VGNDNIPFRAVDEIGTQMEVGVLFELLWSTNAARDIFVTRTRCALEFINIQFESVNAQWLIFPRPVNSLF